MKTVYEAVQHALWNQARVQVWKDGQYTYPVLERLWNHTTLESRSRTINAIRHQISREVSSRYAK